MANEYRVYWLVPGQSTPDGGTGIGVTGRSGGIMWIGEEGTFPTTAIKGDPVGADTYANRLATQAEIDKYNAIVNNEIEDPEIL